MPDTAPSNADLAGAPVPKDGDNAAAILSDERLNDAPGGGGLMGAGAGGAPDGVAQHGVGEGQAGAATPNSPIDAHLPAAADGDVQAEAEARTRSLGDEPGERSAP